MSDHISPEDLDVAAVLSDVADTAAAAADDSADIADITAVLSDIVKSVPAPNDEQLAKSIQLAQTTADAIARLEKSIADIAQALTQLSAPASAAPAAPIVKSVTTVDPSPLDAPAKVEEQLTKSVVLDRALTALTKTDDLAKQVELRSAIARLESNFSPAQIAAELRLI